MERPPALANDMVHEFVIKAHSDLTRVQELLTQEPQLANATWDWGGGDFETALGAAAHTGQKGIAEYLLANGARFDLLAAAMLDQIEVVKTILTLYPALRDTPGAHGIPLIRHAEVGEAKRVLAYLQS